MSSMPNIVLIPVVVSAALLIAILLSPWKRKVLLGIAATFTLPLAMVLHFGVAGTFRDPISSPWVLVAIVYILTTSIPVNAAIVIVALVIRWIGK